MKPLSFQNERTSGNSSFGATVLLSQRSLPSLSSLNDPSVCGATTWVIVGGAAALAWNVEAVTVPEVGAYLDSRVSWVRSGGTSRFEVRPPPGAR